MSRPGTTPPAGLLTLPGPGEDWAAPLRALVADLLARAQAAADAVRTARTDLVTPSQVLRSWDDATRRLAVARDLTGLLAVVHPDPGVRALATDLGARAGHAWADLLQDDAAHAVLSSLPTTGLGDAGLRLLALDLAAMRRAGAGRDEHERDRLRDLADAEQAARLRFERAQDDGDSLLCATPAGLAGLPPRWLDEHPPGADGRVALRRKDVATVLRHADDRDLRLRLRARADAGSPEGHASLRDLLDARDRTARVLGRPDAATLGTEGLLAGDPDRVQAFLDDTAAAARAAADAEHDRFLARLRRSEPGAQALTVADVAWCAQTLAREEHGVDDSTLPRYLPTGPVVERVLGLVGEAFGLAFVPARDAGRWHEDVVVLDVLDRTGSPAAPDDVHGEVLGRVHLDLYPRPGKPAHAAHHVLVAGVRGRALPHSALVLSLPRGHLELRHVASLLHETGHLLHALLAGDGPYAGLGIGGVEPDAVEAPALLLEDWAHDPAVLAAIARDDDGVPAPPALLDAVRAASRTGRALHATAQLSYAAAALDLHRGPGDPDAVWAAARTRYHRPADLPGTRPVEHLGHLGGYASAYHAYPRGRALADRLAPLLPPGAALVPGGAHALRERVLAVGATVPFDEVVRQAVGTASAGD